MSEQHPAKFTTYDTSDDGYAGLFEVPDGSFYHHEEVDRAIAQRDRRIAELGAEIGNLERLNERNVRQADESFVRAQQLEAENKRLRDALAERRWIPVGDRLPNIDERVLVWCADGHIESTELFNVFVEDGETTVIWCSDRVQAGRATHWMPRPQPTEVSDGE